MYQPEIRLVSHEDLSALEHTFRSEYDRTHADDLADQARGEKSFLVAWMDGGPVGHVLVNWRGARQPEPAAAFPGYPEIFRLAVLEPYRHRGIATALVRACESEARQRGHARIGLGTDPAVQEEDNLYIRLGYVDSGIGLFDDVYKVTRGGKVCSVRAKTKFLIKRLG
jgi:GNAT superfamily N-acetyltransferase